MKPEEQRIAIAKACGWKQLFKGEHDRYLRFSPPPERKPEYKYGAYIQGIGHTSILKKEYLVDELPDYLNDLNEIHEAEKTLNRGQKSDFQSYLGEMFPRDSDGDSTGWEGMFSRAIHATASQRSEAVLKCLSLWRD
jgi:hypothetical protein